METYAIAKYVRISPLKINYICAEIRGMQVDKALALLKLTPKRGAKALEKVLASAVANAENNHDMNVEKLYIKAAYVDEGATLKRFQPRAKGSAFEILKRTSHITVVVAER